MASSRNLKERILTTDEVATYARCSKRRVWEAVRRGELEFLDFGRRNRRFTLGAVKRWLAKIEGARAAQEPPQIIL